jgi:hypothetical protein
MEFSSYLAITAVAVSAALLGSAVFTKTDQSGRQQGQVVLNESQISPQKVLRSREMISYYQVAAHADGSAAHSKR